MEPDPSAVQRQFRQVQSLAKRDYFRGFVTLQHQGLLVAQQILPQTSFSQVTEDYLADLHLPSLEVLLDFNRLYHAYEQNIGPLLTLATHQGFTPDWQYLH